METGLARAVGRALFEDRYERMERNFHERVRQGFLKIAHGDPKRCVVIDAAQDEDSVHAAIADTVRERLLVSSTP